MNHRKNGYFDRYALALGSARLASPYVGLTIVPHDHINAVWDERLGGNSSKARSGNGPTRSRLGWAT